MTKLEFKRQESWRLKRVKESWRRPRGGTSRIRLEIRGWPRKPDIGLKTDGQTRGLHPSGLVEQLVNQERDLERLDPKKHIARIGHQVGEKKRLLLVEKIRQMNVKIANPGSIRAAPAPEPGEGPVPESTGSSEDEMSASMDANLQETEKETSLEIESAEEELKK